MRKPLRSSTFCFFTRVVVSDDQGIEEWSNEVTADMAHALRGEAVAVGRAIAKLRAVAHQVAVAALEMVRTRIARAGPTWSAVGWPTPEACSVQLWQPEEQGQVTIVRGDAEDNFV